MNRNYTTEAVVLKTRRFGDFHKSVTILSPETGIIQAVAHGAYKGKSRLSSITDPYSVSVFELYHNPVKDIWKINGCESIVLNDRIREELNAVYNASFWSEIILKSHASGADFVFIYKLYTSALECLNSDNRNALTLTTLFLYRFLYASGFITDFSECGRCGTEIGAESGRSLSFSPVEGCFLCSSCGTAGLPSIDYTTALDLQQSLDIHLAEAAGKRLDLQTGKRTRNMLLAVLKSIMDAPLNTLDYIDYGLE